MRKTTIAIISAFGWMIVGANAHAAPRFELSAVAPESPYGTFFYTSDINDLGQIVGGVSTIEGSYGAVYDKRTNTTIRLSNLPGEGRKQGRAYGINNNGKVVGSSSFTETSQNSQAVIWDLATGSVTALEVDTGAYRSRANSINDSGQIVGTANSVGYLWSEDRPNKIGGSGSSRINNSGIVSAVANPMFVNQDVLFDTKTGLYSVAPPPSSCPTSVKYCGVPNVFTGPLNDRGFAAVTYGYAGEGDVYLWNIESNEISLIHGIYSQYYTAADMNDSNAVIINTLGISYDDNYPFIAPQSYLWQQGIGLIDMNAIAAAQGWELSSLTGINNLGQIVGMGIDKNGEYRGLFFNPVAVPEPDGWALMLAGFGILGSFMRGRLLAQRSETQSC